MFVGILQLINLSMAGLEKEESGTNSRWNWFLAGLVFSILWASASTATKIGLLSAQPLMLAVVRFGVAACLMLAISHLLMRHRLPQKHEWKQLTIYGLLNITVYLGFYVIALQYVTAGIAALAIATNPVFISFISVFFLRKPLAPAVLLALIICSAGVVCAAWPLFEGAVVTANGLFILLFSMLSYSVGAIYFSTRQWQGLHLFTINGWQTLIGGLLLLPFAIAAYDSSKNHFNEHYWFSVLWLALPVSILAVQLWLWLLKSNAIRAGLWLFLCPLFGFAISAWVMKEPISLYTVIGIALVTGGLLIARKIK